MGYERDAGMALLCSAYPLDDIVVQLEDYTETELHAARPTLAEFYIYSGLKLQDQEEWCALRSLMPSFQRC